MERGESLRSFYKWRGNTSSLVLVDERAVLDF
jgi:hypothetical protein